MAHTLRRRRGWVVVSLTAVTGSLALWASSAGGAIVTFTDRTAWQTAASALGTIQDEDFETLPTGALSVGTNQLGSITFDIGLITASTPGASINGSPALGGVRDLSMNADDGMRSYTMSFGDPIHAVGFDFAGAATGGIAVLCRASPLATPVRVRFRPRSSIRTTTASSSSPSRRPPCLSSRRRC